MTDYTIKYTKNSKSPIVLEPKGIDKSTDITLFGRTRLQYGRDMNENLLHLLEKFSCPEDPLNPGNPNLSLSVDNLLSNPVEGQIWVNVTQNRPFFWNSVKWVPLGLLSDYAANSGLVADGNYLPLPISESGYEFTYDECVMIVAPSNLPDSVESFSCSVDTNGLVTCTYNLIGAPSSVSGCANYLIMGIKDNQNNATLS